MQQSPSHSKKKSVHFNDPNLMNFTDGFPKRSPPREGGFFDEVIRKSLAEGSDGDDNLFKRDPLEGTLHPENNPLW